jgi:hypothetical protein
MKGKLSLRYIGPFEVKKIIGLAFKLALPIQLAKIHDVFHVSLLRKVELNLSQVLSQASLEIKEDLTLK